MKNAFLRKVLEAYVLKSRVRHNMTQRHHPQSLALANSTFCRTLNDEGLRNRPHFMCSSISGHFDKVTGSIVALLVIGLILTLIFVAVFVYKWQNLIMKYRWVH